jgi:predicted transcriptional regulator
MLLRSINIIRQEINEYVSHADDSMLREIHAIIEAEQAGDWWNEISDAQKSSIEKGIKDMEAGNTVSHEEMVKMYSKWLTK